MGKATMKESFKFFLVNHCDAVYICSLTIEDTHNKKALILGNLIKRDFVLEGIYIYIYMMKEEKIK